MVGDPSTTTTPCAHSAAEDEGEESEQVEQEGDHRAEILSGSGPTDQRLAGGRGFGEGQGDVHRLLRYPALARLVSSCVVVGHAPDG